MDKAREWFDRCATKVGDVVGSGGAFAIAFALILVWLAAGPILGFTEGWQLTVNTGTTIVTFLLVFLLAHGENKHSQALQLKLDRVLDCLGAGDVIAVEQLDAAALGRVHEAVEEELSERRTDHPAGQGGAL